MKVLGVVPARLKSTRLPEKPLVQICGRSLLDYTLSNLKQCPSVHDILVLADDKRVKVHAEKLGYRALMSPVECTSGIERIAAMRKELQGFDRIAHIQCDEPNIAQQSIEMLCQQSDEPVTTLACLIDAQQAHNPASVKVVFDSAGKALYFSRAKIPYNRSESPTNYYKHIGVYAYQPDFLEMYTHLKKGRYESIEMLEQLTLLENGIQIKVVLVDDHPFGIDTPEDIGAFTRWLSQQNTSLLQAASSPH